jgi:hypothetical protein
MQAFWTAFAQFFGMLTSLFAAGEKAARTLDNIAGVGEMKSSTYLKEAEHDQEVAVAEFAFAREKRRAELAAKRAALTAPQLTTNP